MRSAVLLLALLLGLSGGGVRAAEPLKVFAAASLTEALGDVLLQWEKESGDEAVPVLAASSTLAQQIANGAPADLFISASREWMDELDAKGHLLPATRVPLLGNALVLVVPSDSPLALQDSPAAALEAVLAEGRIAVGDPDHVPAGRYGKDALTSLGLWREIETRLARTADVRGALALVARGEAAAGIVYETDAAITDKVRIVSRFPEDSHPPIIYPAALVKGGDARRAAALLTFLKGGEAAALFRRHGFLPLAAEKAGS